jgi:hypothetical protein
MNKFTLLLITFIVILLACEQEKNTLSFYALESAYDSIRSCPGGGGIFIISLSAPEYTEGMVQLTIESLPDLNAICSRSEIDKDFPVADIVIKPAQTIQTGDYQINVHASNSKYDTNLYLTVSVLSWAAEIGEGPIVKKEEYDFWLHATFPEFSIDNETEWNYAYLTYPEILIVEHVTFLNDTYEYRICTHVMIPPYDWSMIRLRKRNEAEPFFAAKQDSSGGVIYQVPVEEYPELFGY